MKKVLILAYDFPPYVSVGGLRPYSWFKYLNEFGIHPVVVTRQWSNKFGSHLDYVAPGESDQVLIEESDEGTIIRTPFHPNLSNRLLLKHGDQKYTFFRKMISAYYEFNELMFVSGPKNRILVEANNYLNSNKVDAIIATGNPFVLFKYALLLSKKFNIPWIADYRDPWSQDPKRSRNLFLKKWDLFFERKYAFRANYITTVSEYFKEQINSNFWGNNFEIIANGYDPEVLDSIKGINQNKDKLSIGFSGTVTDWNPIEGFMEVINKYVITYPDRPIEFNFYGINIEEKIKNLINLQFPALQSVFNIYPKLTNQELVRELSKNNILLLFNYYSTIGTKIYDYLALQRKIMLCYSDDKEALELKNKFYYRGDSVRSNKNVQIELIEATNSGIVVKDANHLMEVLNQSYHEFTLQKSIKCEPVNIENYSRKSQVKRLANLIGKLTEDFKK